MNPRGFEALKIMEEWDSQDPEEQLIREAEKRRDNITISKYNGRYWALWDGKELVCVTVYKKGAEEVKRRLEGL